MSAATLIVHEQMDGLHTFIVPTYNRSELLKRALESIVHQTNSAWRVMICDNASTDATAAIAKISLEMTVALATTAI